MVQSTAGKPTTEQLKVFATYGTPEQLETDNGLPLNSKAIADVALEEGFEHHRIIPLHPRANGEAENFMKLLIKTEQRARLENKSVNIAIQELLTGYRSTPHPAIRITHFEAMMNLQVRTKIDYKERESRAEISKEEKVNKRDKGYKMNIKVNAGNSNTNPHEFAVGGHVQNTINKWTTPDEPIRYIIYKIRGSSIWARRITDGRKVYRDSTRFKYVDRRRKSKEGRRNRGEPDNWRANILQRAKEGPRKEQNNQTFNEMQNEPEPEPIIDNAPRRSQRIRQRPQHYGNFIYY